MKWRDTAAGRIWRIVLQLVTAMAVFVPAALTALNEAGIQIESGPQFAAVFGVGVTVATMFTNMVLDEVFGGDAPD